MLLNTESVYQSLQSFPTIREMNAAVKNYKQQFQPQLTKSTYEVLDFISTWACKYVGVCYLSQKKIAEELNISYKTVQRSIAVLVDLNVLKKYESKRHNGDKRRSTNILVIQNVQLNDHTECPNVDTPSNTKNINNTIDTVKADSTLNDANKEIEKESMITQALKNKLPKPLQFLGSFFSHDELHRVVGTIFKAKSKVDKDIRIEDHSNEYYEAILSVLSAYKRGKAKSLHSLLFHSIKVVTVSIQLKTRLFGAFGL